MSLKHLIPIQVQETKNIIRMLKFIILFFFLSSGQIFAQRSVYDCNVKLINNCDTLRSLMKGKRPVPKINYKKMLKRDKKVIAFLNAYRSDTLSLNGLNKILTEVNHYNYTSYKKNDTINYAGHISEDGLVRIYFRYSYLEGGTRLIRRFYDLEINNADKGFDRPFDYHYKIFKLLKFCLGRRFSCYNFDEEF